MNRPQTFRPMVDENGNLRSIGAIIPGVVPDAEDTGTEDEVVRPDVYQKEDGTFAFIKPVTG